MIAEGCLSLIVGCWLLTVVRGRSLLVVNVLFIVMLLFGNRCLLRVLYWLLARVVSFVGVCCKCVVAVLLGACFSLFGIRRSLSCAVVCCSWCCLIFCFIG